MNVYTVPTCRVIFTVISFNVFSLRREYVSIYPVLADCICEMKRGTESEQQGMKTFDHVCCTLTPGEPSTDQKLNPQDHLISAGFQ